MQWRTNSFSSRDLDYAFVMEDHDEGPKKLTVQFVRAPEKRARTIVLH